MARRQLTVPSGLIGWLLVVVLIAVLISSVGGTAVATPETPVSSDSESNTGLSGPEHSGIPDRRSLAETTGLQRAPVSHALGETETTGVGHGVSNSSERTSRRKRHRPAVPKSGHDGTPTNLQPTIVADYTFRLTPDRAGSVEVELQWDLPPTVSAFQAALPLGTSVVSTTDFERNDDGTYQWTEATRSPSITFTWSVSTTALDSSGSESVDVGEWALLTRPDVDTSWRYTDDAPDYRVAMTVDGTGQAAGRIAYLGPHAVRTIEVPNQQIRMVVPTAVQRIDADATASLRTAATVLQVGDRDAVVTAFVVPESIRFPGFDGVEYQDAFWIRAGLDARTPNNVWAHEYVHTRQAYDPDVSMLWLDEGSADYYAALVAYRAELISYDWFHQFVSTDSYADAVLSNPDTWSTYRVEYVKGRRVVAALDAEIRARTANRTFMDVMRRLNAHDGELTYEDFREAVVAVAGESLGSWVDEYVTTSAAPSVPYDRDRYGPGGLGEDDPPETTPTSPTETTTPADGPDDTANSADGETDDQRRADDIEADDVAREIETIVPGFGAITALLALLVVVAFNRRRYR